MEQKCCSSKTTIIGVVILGVALVGAFGLHGKLMSSRNDNGLTVTGSVKKQVTSDLAKWSAAFTLQANLSNLKATLDKNQANKEKLTKFITDLGIDPKGITFLPAQTNSIYEQLPGYGYTQNVIGYNVVQEIKVESNDINKIEQLGSKLTSIVDLGMVPDYQRTEYFYTKLDDLRPQLFADATADAQKRAVAIASGTNAKVTKLLSARTGIIQVLQPNSTDVSDYGTYDLSTKEKEVSATVSVTFGLK